MQLSPRVSRLGLVALGALAAWTLALLQLPLFFGTFPHHPKVLDFANYVAAARVGLADGWSRIYDRSLQGPVYVALTGVPRFEWHQTFVSPPPLAWVVAPIARFDLDFAYWTWTLVGAATLSYACWRVNPWRGLPKAVSLLVGAGLYPVLVALELGQVTPMIAAGVALAFVQLERGRQVRAAMLLLPVALKPQVAVLVPVALAVAGYWRCCAWWAFATALIAAASAATLGLDGIRQYVADVQLVQSHPDNQTWTLAIFFGAGPIALAAEAACAVAAIGAAWLSRRGGPAVPVVAGALGSLLGAGYHHQIDFPELLPLAFIQLHYLRGAPASWFCVAGIAACYTTPRFGPIPLLLFAVVWLGAIVWTAAGALTMRARPENGLRSTPPAVASDAE